MGRGYSSLWCVGFSFLWLLCCWRAQALGSWASVVAACGLSSRGSQALECGLSSCGPWLSCSVACGIFLEQGSTYVLSIARQIFKHWTTREALHIVFTWVYLSNSKPIIIYSPLMSSCGLISSRQVDLDCLGLGHCPKLALHSLLHLALLDSWYNRFGDWYGILF